MAGRYGRQAGRYGRQVSMAGRQVWQAGKYGRQAGMAGRQIWQAGKYGRQAGMAGSCLRASFKVRWDKKYDDRVPLGQRLGCLHVCVCVCLCSGEFRYFAKVAGS